MGRAWSEQQVLRFLVACKTTESITTPAGFGGARPPEDQGGVGLDAVQEVSGYPGHTGRLLCEAAYAWIGEPCFLQGS